MIGASSVLAWVMFVGLMVSIGPAILAIPSGPPLTTPIVAGIVVVGLSYNVGLLLAYLALSIGRVSIVTPITATEGAVAALISVALGEHLGAPTAVILAVIVVGILLAAYERSADPPASRVNWDPSTARRTVVLAILASLAFSVGLVVSARLGETVPISWIIAGARAVGVGLIFLPLLVRGRLRLTRQAIPFVLVSGVLEAAGTALYVTGAQEGIAATAVLSSQFAPIAAIGAYLLFGERLARVQLLGVVILIAGVTTLAFVRATLPGS